MHEREWEPPHVLHEGFNVNVLGETLDAALNQVSESGQLDSGHGLITYRDITAATTWVAIKFALWNVWQRLWHGIECRTIIIPSQACTSLVNRTRNGLEVSGVMDVRLSFGDIIAAWFFKVCIHVFNVLVRTHLESYL
jgi:hypothetical protein